MLGFWCFTTRLLSAGLIVLARPCHVAVRVSYVSHINCMFDEEHTVLNSYTTVHKQMFRVLSRCRSSRRVVLWSRLSLQIWHLMFLRMHGANSKVGSYGSSHHPVYTGTVCLHAAVALILEGLRIRVCPCTASDVYHATLGAASRNVLNVRRSLPHCGSHNS